MAQHPEAPALLSVAIHAIAPERILEIGTGSGGLSVLLALYARKTGADFVTIDRNECDPLAAAVIDSVPRRVPLRSSTGAWPSRVVCDVWAREYAVNEFLSNPGRVLLLCDGGDKERELRTFAPALKAGDFVMVHDYLGATEPEWRWVEIRLDRITDLLEEQALVPSYEYLERVAWGCFGKWER
jgi:cephalosporin hydroxylase